MRIAATADLHGYLPDVPECDVLVVAGDLGPATKRYHRDEHHAVNWLMREFVPWFRSQPARHVVVIAGNHDFVLKDGFPFNHVYPCFHYLMDSGCEIEGVKFWGSPWTPTFFDWAFMKDDSELAEHWAMIPDDTDVLVTHGPPRHVLDTNGRGESCGSVSLLQRVGEMRLKHVKPRLHCFGHIHRDTIGNEMVNGVFANVSHVNEIYQPVNPVRVFEVQ